MRKTNIAILTMVLLTLTNLYGGKVKVFDLNNQILNSMGAKIEKFQVSNELIVETNMILCANKQCYIEKGNRQNTFFALDFSQPQVAFKIHMVASPKRLGGSTWRFVDEFGETQYIYFRLDGNGYMHFNINNKKSATYETSYDIKLIVKNKKVTVYANNEKIGSLNLSNLDGIKRIEFNKLETLSDLSIIKEK